MKTQKIQNLLVVTLLCAAVLVALALVLNIAACLRAGKQ